MIHRIADLCRQGGIGMKTQNKGVITADLTLTQDDVGCMVLISNAAARVVNLPSAVTSGPGAVMGILKTGGGAYALTLTRTGSETINGATTNAVLDANYDCGILISDGTNWFFETSVLH